MKTDEMLSYNPELERCRQVRAEIDSQYKSVREALADLDHPRLAARKSKAKSVLVTARPIAAKSRKKSA